MLFIILQKTDFYINDFQWKIYLVGKRRTHKVIFCNFIAPIDTSKIISEVFKAQLSKLYQNTWYKLTSGLIHLVSIIQEEKYTMKIIKK